MEYLFEYGYEGGAGTAILYLLYLLATGIFSVAAYVLRSMGVQTIAKRRGIKRPWFAWVPVLDQYLLGCISDQYQYVVKGRNKNKRTLLLWLNVGKTLVGLGFGGVYAWMVAIVSRVLFSGGGEDAIMQALMSPLAAVMGLSIPMLILGLVTLIFRYIALYDLYTSCSPANNVLFLVLGIFFKVIEPFFIFGVRNQDRGMPPRKAEASAAQEPEIALPVAEADPWDRPDREEME